MVQLLPKGEGHRRHQDQANSRKLRRAKAKQKRKAELAAIFGESKPVGGKKT